METTIKILKQQMPSKPRTRKKTRDYNGLFDFDAQPSPIATSPKASKENVHTGERKDRYAYKEFYKDTSAYYQVERFLPQDTSIKMRFKEDMLWFQEEYMKGPSSKYYANFDRDNGSVIRSFERYIRKKDYSNRIDVERICTVLTQIYVNK